MRIIVNKKTYEIDVPSDMPLLWVLRDIIGLKGTKFGCGVAQCGSCTVHIDGTPTRACITPIGTIENAQITTIEGVTETREGAAVFQAWQDIDVIQCGYCQCGQIMSATALITNNKNPSDKDIDEAMDGNFCRCGTYLRIREAIKKAAGVNTNDTREA